ncbi:DUF6188 family protein [Sorangium sp. So ce315]|uniref:DUF6188 family protein n=1 Tax=Sorangium sp. So ce315 TaxID=3133299 RepID=UPI003F638C0F
MSRLCCALPVAGHALRDVEGDGRFCLEFDDAAESCLFIEGPFFLSAGGEVEGFVPPHAEWVQDVLLSLIGVRVEFARYDRNSSLRIKFADGRELFVPDGPFEDWHYSNNTGTRLHGGLVVSAECIKGHAAQRPVVSAQPSPWSLSVLARVDDARRGAASAKARATASGHDRHRRGTLPRHEARRARLEPCWRRSGAPRSRVRRGSR